jgi:hypothetical protein
MNIVFIAIAGSLVVGFSRQADPRCWLTYRSYKYDDVAGVDLDDR